MKKSKILLYAILMSAFLTACSNQVNSTREQGKQIKEANKIAECIGSGCEATVDGDSISFVYQYSSSKSKIEEAIQMCEDAGFTVIDMEIHGKNSIGYCHIDEDGEEYTVKYDGLTYNSYREDFFRACESWYPYLISQEASDLLYLEYHLTSKDFYKEYKYTPDGVFTYISETEDDFFKYVCPRSYEIASALFEADESIQQIDFNVKNSYYGAHYVREESGQISEEFYGEEETTKESEPSPTGLDPADIHTYVDCGEIVQYSDLTEDGDFGDVDVEEVYTSRYVVIYSDGTFYYMFDYMSDKITIAYIN